MGQSGLSSPGRCLVVALAVVPLAVAASGCLGTGPSPSVDPTPTPTPLPSAALRLVRQLGSEGDQLATRVFALGAGVAVHGEFGGALTLEEEPYEARGLTDSFWLELDEEDQDIGHWVISSPGFDQMIVAPTPEGGLVATGTYEQGLSLGAFDLPGAGGEDVFLAARSPEGTVDWALAFGDPGLQHNGEVLLVGGEVLVTGFLESGTMDFGGGPLSVDVDTCGNFLLRFSRDGVHRGSRLFDGVNSDWGLRLAPGPEGALGLIGEARGDAALGGGVLPSPRDDADIIAGIIEADGSHRWSRRLGEEGEQFSHHGLWVGDELIVGGTSTSPFDIGTGLLEPEGDSGLLLAGLDVLDGSTQWAVVSSGAGAAELFSLSYGPSGSILLGGWYQGEPDLGCGPLPLSDAWRGFAAALEPGGACRWHLGLEGTGISWIEGMAVGPDDSVWMVGAFTETAWGLDLEMTSRGGLDGFLLQRTEGG